MGRKLSPEEVAALGLPPKRRKLDPSEAQALGLGAKVLPGRPQVNDPPAYDPELDVSPAREAADRPGIAADDAAALGVGQGFTLDSTDEGVGALRALFAGIDRATGQAKPGGPPLMDVYRDGRDATRQALKTADAAQPAATFAGRVGGDMALQALLAYLTKGASMTPAGQGAVGMLSGLGSTEAELTPDKATNADVARASAESTASGLLSAGLTKVGKTIGDKIAKRATSGISNAVGQQLAKEQDTLAKTAASAEGTANNLKAQVMKTWERLMETVADPLASTEAKAAAKAELANPELRAVTNEVMLNYAKGASGGRSAYQTAKALAAETAEAVADPGVAAQATDAALEGGFKKTVAPRVKTWVSRAIPPLVTAGAVKAGLDPIVAGGLGLGTAMTIGRPGTAFMNMVKDPRFRNVAWKGVLAGKDMVLDPLAAPITPAVRQSDTAQDIVEYLLSKDEEEGR